MFTRESTQAPVKSGAGPPLRSIRYTEIQSLRQFASCQPQGNHAIQQRLTSKAIQPKLTLNAPGDRFEREADSVAEHVMRMPDPVLQQGALSGVPQVQRVCTECEEELHRKPASSRDAVGEGFQHPSGGGRPLPDSERSFFEPRFGRDFSQVRTYSGEQAAGAAQSVNALAYTMGSDIVFGRGQYSPGTTGGRTLLAHELTHVVQQGAATSGAGASPPSVQRLGDVSQVPAGLTCPVPGPALLDPVHTNVLFPISSSALSPAATADIAAFVAAWNAAGANRAIRVDGFASTDGPQALNWTLSCNRAEAVVRELTGPGAIDPRFIEPFAQGETSEFSTTDLTLNRRATIRSDLAAAPVPVCANPGNTRVLDLQPVFLRTDPADAAPTGVSWSRRFNEANVIWGKLGVRFVELSAVTIDTALKANGTNDAEINAVRALRSAAGVEVFLVDNDMASSGGASKAPGPGASCGAVGNIVMSDRGTSDTLLAHELGHILGLQHPGTPPNPGEAGTIIEPSGGGAILGHSVPNPTRNTIANFNAILCPPRGAPVCLNPDA